MKTYELITDHAVYHTVTEIPLGPAFKMRDWCRELFGESIDLRFGGRWESPIYSVMRFKNDEDRTLFLLRWG